MIQRVSVPESDHWTFLSQINHQSQQHVSTDTNTWTDTCRLRSNVFVQLGGVCPAIDQSQATSHFTAEDISTKFLHPRAEPSVALPFLDPLRTVLKSFWAVFWQTDGLKQDHRRLLGQQNRNSTRRIREARRTRTSVLPSRCIKCLHGLTSLLTSITDWLFTDL